LLARASLGKESAKSVATVSPKPSHVHEQFSIEPPLPEQEFTAPKFPWSIGKVAVTAPSDGDGTGDGDDGGPVPAKRGFTQLPWPIQAKLKVGAVDDPLEREADRVAERVMRMPDTWAAAGAFSKSALGVQRKCACGGSCDDCKKQHDDEEHAHIQRTAAGPSSTRRMEAPPIVHEVLRSPGQPLDKATRNYMEPRFGRDFGSVRVHTDSAAAESAHQVNANAYTAGHHVAFGGGRFAPATNAGRQLLAHELTHVVQQEGQYGQSGQLQRQPNQFSECTTCRSHMSGGTYEPMSGSSTSLLPPLSHSGMFEWVKEEAWQAAIGHDRPTVIYSLLQRHEDSALNAFWRFYIATSEWAGIPGPEWTRMVEELNQRAIGMLVQEIKDTLRSRAILKGSFYEGDRKRIKQIEDTPDEEGLSLSIGMGAHDVIKPKRELAGLRVRSASPNVLYYEVIGHEHIYFGISEYDLRVKGGTAALIAKEAASGSELLVDLLDAVGKFAKGLLTAFASPVEMIIDTAAKIIDLLSLYTARRVKQEYGYDNFPYTCLSSTCKQAKTCLDGGNSVQDCQVTALREAVETATMVVPLYRQGRDCLGGDYEACGSIAPVILGFMPKGGRALKTAELEGAISKAKSAELKTGAPKIEEVPPAALEAGKPLTQAEFEDAAIREAIGRPEAHGRRFGKAMEEEPRPAVTKAPHDEPGSPAKLETEAAAEEAVHSAAGRTHSEVTLSDGTHGIAPYEDGGEAGVLFCTDCSLLSKKLAEIVKGLPEGYEFKKDLAFLRDKFHGLDEQISGGRGKKIIKDPVVAANLDIATKEAAKQLQRFAKEDPRLGKLLELDPKKLKSARKVWSTRFETENLTEAAKRSRDIEDLFAEKQRLPESEHEAGLTEDPKARARITKKASPGRVPRPFERGNFAHRFAERLLGRDRLPRPNEAEVRVEFRDGTGDNIRVDRMIRNPVQGFLLEIKPAGESTIIGRAQLPGRLEALQREFPRRDGWRGEVIDYTPEDLREWLESEDVPAENIPALMEELGF
jgi:Domain of unknown function (DUF4157)